MSPDFRDWSNPNAIARLSAAETRYLVHRTLEAASPATRPWPWRNPAAVWESLAADFDRVANDADASDAMRDFAAAVVRGPRVHGASILVAAAGLHGREAERAMRDALERASRLHTARFQWVDPTKAPPPQIFPRCFCTRWRASAAARPRTDGSRERPAARELMNGGRALRITGGLATRALQPASSGKNGKPGKAGGRAASHLRAHEVSEL